MPFTSACAYDDDYFCMGRGFGASSAEDKVEQALAAIIAGVERGSDTALPRREVARTNIIKSYEGAQQSRQAAQLLTRKSTLGLSPMVSLPDIEFSTSSYRR